MTQRKWLAECHAWLDDPTSVQCQVRTEWQVPQGLNNPIAYPGQNWRIKPVAITINGTELPRPVENFDPGQISFTLVGPERNTFWFNTREDRDAVYNKLVEVLGS
jgi:hypothetical protein